MMGATESHDGELDDIVDQVAEAFGVGRRKSPISKPKTSSVKGRGGLELLAEWIETNQARNIVVLSGAGVSTGAGIPDFRSPGTGLYDNLQKYDLPYPQAIFDVSYYRRNPGAFVALAGEIWPGVTFSPTLTHSFLKLLCDRGMLRRLYTQNIDGLEFLAGIPAERLVECHGHFRTASCIDCRNPADAKVAKETIVGEGTTPICSHCGGNVKPDIVFFGESLPNRFHELLQEDMTKADLLLVMGTSLQVAPVSLIPNMVKCNKVLFNRDLVMRITEGDVFIPGDCDTNVRALADLLGWGEVLAEANEACQLQKEEGEDNETHEEYESTGGEVKAAEGDDGCCPSDSDSATHSQSVGRSELDSES